MSLSGVNDETLRRPGDGPAVSRSGLLFRQVQMGTHHL